MITLIYVSIAYWFDGYGLGKRISPPRELATHNRHLRNGEKEMSTLLEKNMVNVFTELDQAGKDYLLQIQHDRLSYLSDTIMDAVDMLVPENVAHYGKTVTILNLRLMLEMALDEALTDNQEDSC